MVETTREMSVKPATKKDITMVSSYGHAVILGGKPMIIGERINPTGKKKFKQALKDHDMDYILKEGITQQDKGAHILDVNVGLPDIDEPAMMKEVIMEPVSYTHLKGRRNFRLFERRRQTCWKRRSRKAWKT